MPTIGGAEIRSEVIDWVPERILGIAWKTADWIGGAIEWELEPDGGETKLTNQHVEKIIGPSHMTGAQANWHMMLDMFGTSLAGKPMSWNWDLWQEYFLHYVRNLPYAQWV